MLDRRLEVGGWGELDGSGEETAERIAGEQGTAGEQLTSGISLLLFTQL